MREASGIEKIVAAVEFLRSCAESTRQSCATTLVGTIAMLESMAKQLPPGNEADEARSLIAKLKSRSSEVDRLVGEIESYLATLQWVATQIPPEAPHLAQLAFQNAMKVHHIFSEIREDAERASELAEHVRTTTLEGQS